MTQTQEPPPLEARAAASTIAQRLGETARAPLGQIWRIVRRLGPEAALAWLEKAEAIEAQGGLMTTEGKRRTPGGVYFRIVKDGISPKDRAAIFFVAQQRQRGASRPSGIPAQPQKPTQPAPAPIEIGQLPNLTGEARTVKITLIGRPGPIATKGEYIITTMTAAENVELALAFGGLRGREREARAGELLRRVGLGERQDHRPTELSGGEQQRVAIARALANRPRALLADEPTGNLDSTRAVELLSLLREMVAADKLTVLMVTHDRDLAARFADRTIQMRDGKVETIKDEKP